jgi:hypothetical protein
VIRKIAKMGKRKKTGRNKNSFKIKELSQLERNATPSDRIVELSNNYYDIVKKAEKSGNKQDLAAGYFGLV